MYPYKLNVSDQDLQKVLRMLSSKRAAKIPDRTTSIKLGIHLCDIRQDIYMGSDEKYARSFIALAPEIELSIDEHGKRLDAIFKRIF
jgi:hypothetical protein